MLSVDDGASVIFCCVSYCICGMEHSDTAQRASLMPVILKIFLSKNTQSKSFICNLDLANPPAAISRAHLSGTIQYNTVARYCSTVQYCPLTCTVLSRSKSLLRRRLRALQKLTYISTAPVILPSSSRPPPLVLRYTPSPCAFLLHYQYYLYLAMPPPGADHTTTNGSTSDATAQKRVLQYVFICIPPRSPLPLASRFLPIANCSSHYPLSLSPFTGLPFQRMTFSSLLMVPPPTIFSTLAWYVFIITPHITYQPLQSILFSLPFLD